MGRLTAQILFSSSKKEKQAIKEIKDQLSIVNLEAILFFCSSNYNLSIIAKEMEGAFDTELVGCTTAGEIAGEYLTQSFVALALSSEVFSFHPTLIRDLQSFDLAEAMCIANAVERKLKHSQHFNAEKMFGFLLSDGLSLKEENLISRLSQAFEAIEIFGGSAGDDLAFKETHVFFKGECLENAAIINVIEVKDDFELFKTQHFIPTGKELITTEVDFEKRIVKEINGEPAGIAYAKINGLDPKKLTSIDFAMYPLMINLSDEWYIRSIASINPDMSLQFYCAIDEGLPLSIASGQDMLTRLDERVEIITSKFEEIYFTLGCDCILRRLENEYNNALKDFDKTFSKLKFIGFNSYGEQYNGVHFNQTLAAVVVGRKRSDNNR